MYHNLAIKLTSYFISQNENNDVDKEIAVYGAELLLSSFVNIIIVIIIGLVLNKLPEVIIFLMFFCPIRKLAGGYHAPNYLLCTLTFSVYLITLLIINFSFGFISQLIILAFCNTVILLLSPVEDKNKPLGKVRTITLRKKVRIYMFLEDVIYVILLLLNIKESFITFVLYAFVTVSILLILGNIKNKIIGGKKDVKKINE